MQLQNLEKKRRKWLLSNEMMDNFFSLSAISRFQEMPALYLEKMIVHLNDEGLFITP